MQASGSDNYPAFQAENTEVVGISANAPFSQKAFADFAKINYALLSDRDGKVMQTYGVYDEPRRVAKRSYIIVDKEGVIRYLNIRPGDAEKNLFVDRRIIERSKKGKQRQVIIVLNLKGEQVVMVRKLLTGAFFGVFALAVSTQVFAQADVIRKGKTP